MQAISNSRMAYVMKIMNVVEKCMRSRRNLMREGKMRVRNEAKVVSRRCKRDWSNHY